MSLPGLLQRADRSLALRLLAILLIAAALRLALVAGRSALDPSYHETLIPGNDQTAYVEMATWFYEGRPLTQAFYFQPGKSLWMLPWLLISGGSLGFARVVELICGALSPLLVYDALRLLQSRRAGLIGALLAALYPVTAFFETSYLTSSTEVLFVLLALWFSVRLWRRPWWGLALGAGLSIGMGMLVRMTLLGLLPSALLSIWLAREISPGRRAGLAAITLAALAITVAPVSYVNTLLTGRFTLSSTAGSYTLYLGNNRDAGGTNEVTQAMVGQHLLGDSYSQAVLRDFRYDPAYMIALQARKLGLMMNSLEVPNNLDFYANGLDLAPAIRVSPLNFGRVALFALAGLIYVGMQISGDVAGARRGRASTPPRDTLGALIPAAFFLIYWGGTALIWVNSRVRLAIVPAALMLAALFIEHLLRRDGRWRPKWIALAGSAALLAALGLMVHTLPAPRFQHAERLPEGFTALDHRFDEHLSLRGYRMDQDEAYPRTALYVTLLWQIDEATSVNYTGFASLTDAQGQPIFAGDIRIGAASHPGTPTSEWPAGTGFREQIMLLLPQDSPTPAHGYLSIGLLDPLTGEALGQSITLPERVRIVERWPYPPDPLATAAGLDFGGLIRLDAYALEQGEDQLRVQINWAALAQPGEDLHLFLHLLDGSGALVAQLDGPPLGGALPTSLWRAGDQWRDELLLPLPPDLPAGVYTLRAGLYRYPDGARLAIAPLEGFEIQDNAVTLGQIELDR